MKINFTTDVKAATCELCEQVAELRPYGPNGENICFDCGNKDRTATEKQMHRRMKQAEVSLGKIKDLFKGKLDS